MTKHWKGLYRLLQRYQNGTINPIKKQVVDFWYDSLGSKEMGTDSDLIEDSQLKMEMWGSIRRRMHDHEESSEPIVVTRWWQSAYVTLTAACAVLIVGFFIYKRSISDKDSVIAKVPDSEINKLVRDTNAGQQVKTVKLSDGSEVTLDPGATLYYPAVFAGTERKVFLKGNGFFNVTSNKKVPFLVYSDHIITKVVGTSFTIRKKDGESIEVAVVTGVVKVQNNSGTISGLPENNEVTLTRNKKVTFFPENQTMLTGLVEQPAIRQEENANKQEFGSFNYQDESLLKIVRQLESAYGVTITLGNKNLESCSITADVSHFKDLFSQLDILCAALGASYQLKEDVVVLNGPGCKIK